MEVWGCIGPAELQKRKTYIQLNSIRNDLYVQI
jgi:hypothetical protein